MSRIGKNSQKRRRSRSQIIPSLNSNKLQRKRSQRQKVKSLIFKENQQIWNNKDSKSILEEFSQTHRKLISSQLVYHGKGENDSHKTSYVQSSAKYDKLIETDFLQKLQDDKLAINPNDHVLSRKSSNNQNDSNDEPQNESNAIILKWIQKFERDRKFTFRCFEDFTKSKMNLLSEKPLNVPSSYNQRLKVALCCLVLQNLVDAHLPIVHPKLKQLLKKEIFESIYCSFITNDKQHKLKQFYESLPYFIVNQKINAEQETDSSKLEKAQKKIDMIRGVLRAQGALKNLLKMVKSNDFLRKVLVNWKKYTSKKIGKRKIALIFCHKLVENWTKMNANSLFRAWKDQIIQNKRDEKQKMINKLTEEIHSQFRYERQTQQHIQDLQDNINNLMIKMRLNEPCNEVRSAKSKSLSFSQRIQAQSKFQMLLQKLREIKSELTDFVITPHFNVELIFDDEDVDTNSLTIEQYAMFWLKYQLQWIRTKQIKQKRAHSVIIDKIQYNKIEQILEAVLSQTTYDNFDQDFENGFIWLLLFFYLFQGKGFRDLSELNSLCDPQTNSSKRINKIISLYTATLLTSENTEETNILINHHKLKENDVSCNFILLLTFISKNSNLVLVDDDIALFKVRINRGIKQCSSAISKMINNNNASLFQKEASKVEQIIKSMEKTKMRLISNHNKWCDIQHQIQKRIYIETNNYKLGKLVLIQPIMNINRIIPKLLEMDYVFVKPIFERYYKTRHQNIDHVANLALIDFRSIPRVINDNLSVIFYLLNKYLDPLSMTITLNDWNKLSEDLHIRSKLNMQKLFKTSSSKRDIQYFVPLLLFAADTIYHKESCKTSDKLEMLLQRHILEQIHPQSNIVSVTNLHSIVLVAQEKQSKLNDIFSRLVSDSINKKEINSDSLIQLLSKQTNLSKNALTQMNLKQTLDFDGFYGIICLFARSQSGYNSFCDTVSTFVDKL